MAERPWVTPQELRAYSADPAIAERTEPRLAVDIARAEMRVIGYCNNDFADPCKYPVIPQDVKIAVLLVAEYLATRAQAAAGGRGGVYKSETLDDYSYTMQDTDAAISDLDLGSLLDAYKISKVIHGLKMDAHVW